MSRQVSADEQAGIRHTGAHERDVAEHVNRLLHPCGSVHVAAEGGTDALQIVQDGFPREILRAVEAHMLQKVSQAVLVRGLLDGAYIGRQVEFGPLGGNGVVTDVIGKSVVQRPATDERVTRYLRDHRLEFFFRIRLREGGQGRRHQRNKDEKSFHNFILSAYKDKQKNLSLQHIRKSY